MWPFKKKAPSLDRLPVAGPWSVAVGQRDGHVRIVRANAGYREVRNVRGYEHRVAIAVPCRTIGLNGLPSPAEDTELGEIESHICRILEAEAESLLVAVVTADGLREFVLYTRDPERVRQRFHQLRDRTANHQLHLTIQFDKAWEAYGQLG